MKKTVYNKNALPVLLLALLAAGFLAFCEMNGDDTNGTEKPPADNVELSVSAALSEDGSALRLSLDVPAAGTVYALLLGAESPAPETSAQVRDSADTAGKPVVKGQNTFDISDLAAGDYTVYVVFANSEGALSETLVTLEGIHAAPFQIAGSKWYMGAGCLTFGDDGKARMHDFAYDYTYNGEERSGYVSGHVNQRTTEYDGKACGDIINALGNFTVDTDEEGFLAGLTFADYRESWEEVSFGLSRVEVPPDRLTGTCWSWGGSGLTLEFLPNGKVIQWSPTGYYPHPHVYTSYTFNPAYVYAEYDDGDRSPWKIGVISKAERVCSYSGAITALGAFVILNNFTDEDKIVRDQCLYFPGPEHRLHVREPFNELGYKAYRHRADYAKRTDD